MRVISGKYKGKKLDGFYIDGTRPTMDRVKESLFSIIQGNIKDSVVLDLFAGSGSLGIEAISNGATKAILVDNNIKAIEIIKNNIKNIGKEIKVFKSDYKDALKLFNGIKFDIIFLDPPYKLNLINDCLNKIKELDLLSDNGIIVCEYENELIDNFNFELIKEKKYGKKKIIILKNKM